jgi:hypothetical protein
MAVTSVDSSNEVGNSGAFIYELPLAALPQGFSLSQGPGNPPAPPAPASPFVAASTLASSQWLTTDIWPVNTFTPVVNSINWQGISAGVNNTVTLVQNGLAISPTSVPYSNLGGWGQSNLPTIRAMPSVRRRVYWVAVNQLSNQATSNCASCTCSVGVVTVNNNDQLSQSCTWLYGISNATASTWTEGFSLASTPTPIDALKSFLQTISANVQHTDTTTITINQQSTTSDTFNCQMAAGFQLGFYDQCELWQMHEVYDIVGPDQQPWSDPVYQVVLPNVIDNPLNNSVWNSSYFDCRNGNNACVPITH